MNAPRALAVGFALLPATIAAQSVRITGATSFRYIELRPFIRDSVPAGATEGSELLRQLPDGRVVRCIPGEAFCRDVRPGSAISTFPAIHDIDATAWGFGQGIRLVAQVRARSALGAHRELWPQGDDAIDVQSLYGELTRDRWRLRAGRQWKVSGLGYYNFDGLAGAIRPMPTLWIEAYAGRSLVRGLNEARTGAALKPSSRCRCRTPDFSPEYMPGIGHRLASPSARCTRSTFVVTAVDCTPSSLRPTLSSVSATGPRRAPLKWTRPRAP
jgi:hypothetical protein